MGHSGTLELLKKRGTNRRVTWLNWIGPYRWLRCTTASWVTLQNGNWSGCSPDSFDEASSMIFTTKKPDRKLFENKKKRKVFSFQFLLTEESGILGVSAPDIRRHRAIGSVSVWRTKDNQRYQFCFINKAHVSLTGQHSSCLAKLFQATYNRLSISFIGRSLWQLQHKVIWHRSWNSLKTKQKIWQGQAGHNTYHYTAKLIFPT